MKNTTIDKLIVLVKKNFTFTSDVYPELQNVDDQQKLQFSIRHIALHLSKTAGKVSAVSEDVDHGGELDMTIIKKEVLNSFTSAFRLAELAGINEEELISMIEERYQDKI